MGSLGPLVGRHVRRYLPFYVFGLAWMVMMAVLPTRAPRTVSAGDQIGLPRSAGGEGGGEDGLGAGGSGEGSGAAGGAAGGTGAAAGATGGGGGSGGGKAA